MDLYFIDGAVKRQKNLDPCFGTTILSLISGMIISLRKKEIRFYEHNNMSLNKEMKKLRRKTIV